MAQSTSASDSENTASTPRVKGLAQIALGAAAGAFLASRMNRGALLLTAGLAYSVWKKGQETQAASNQSGESLPSITPDERPIIEAVTPEETLSDPTLIAEESVVPTEAEPEAHAPDTVPIAIIPEIAPVSAPPHIAPFLSFPVIEQPLTQADPVVEPDLEPAPPALDLALAEPTKDTHDKAPESQEFSAWEELRAALTPTYPSAPPRIDLNAEDTVAATNKAPVEPQHVIPSFESVTFSAPAPLLEAPPMVDLTVCQPSSPLIHTPITEGVDIPDEIQLPEPVEESAAEREDFLLDQTAITEPEAPINPPTKPITVIVPRQDIKFTPPVSPPSVPDETTPNSLSAPVVIPRDVQAKKSFFDWLRG